jgi:hypothetical protein
MSEIVHLLIVALVLCILVYVAQQAPIPEPFRWIAWVVVFIVALMALLPFLGVHVPA